jgi:hypothetical protein
LRGARPPEGLLRVEHQARLMQTRDRQLVAGNSRMPRSVRNEAATCVTAVMRSGGCAVPPRCGISSSRTPSGTATSASTAPARNATFAGSFTNPPSPKRTRASRKTTGRGETSTGNAPHAARAASMLTIHPPDRDTAGRLQTGGVRGPAQDAEPRPSGVEGDRRPSAVADFNRSQRSGVP